MFIIEECVKLHRFWKIFSDKKYMVYFNKYIISQHLYILPWKMLLEYIYFSAKLNWKDWVISWYYVMISTSHFKLQ